VTRIASIAAGSRPRLRRRRSTSRTPNPQSTSTQPAASPPSTSSALPSLPLPRLAKRTALLHLLLQQRQDACDGLAVDLADGLALRVAHLDDAAIALAAHLDPEARAGFGARFAAEQARQEAGFFAGATAFDLRIDVADEIHALRTVAILDGEAAAIERQADTPPGAVEALGQFEVLRLAAVHQRDALRGVAA